MSPDLVEYNTASVFAILESVKQRRSDEIESETIEFKEYASEQALHNDKDIAGEICALANWKGGVLISGVRDGSKLHGTDYPSQLVGFPAVDTTSTEERIKGRLQNSVNIRAENITYEGKNFLAIFVRKHRDSLVITRGGKAYIREGRSSRPMTPEEVERAVKSLQNYDWSADFLADVTLDHLDEKVVAEIPCPSDCVITT